MKSEALIGRTIAGKYEVEALVGQGAMGCVYRARQCALGTTLAVKVLHRQLAGEPMFAARFLREAQAASRIDHPSSMRVVDFGEEPDGLLYIAMEYVDGRTLAQVIEQDAPLPVTRIVDIASQALAALAVAHDLGVVHRDLKPENIMIIEGQDDEGRVHDLVKVCDFGVAKLLEGGARGPSVTAQGVVVGTPEYMSPEQARGEALDARSDIYAMGVLLFQLMTGKVPFDSSTAFGTALMHVNDEPTRPRLLNPRVDSRLEKICLKAMRKRPGDRHASARELRAELRALLGHDDDEADAVVPASLLAQIEARPRRSGLLIAAVVCAATLAAGEYLYHRPAQQAAAPHEPVQTATLTSAALPVSPRAIQAPEPATAAPPPEAAVTSEGNTRASRAHAAPRANARRAKGHGAPTALGEEAPPIDAKAKAEADADAKIDADAKAIAKPAAKPAAVNPDPKPDAAKPDAKPAEPKKPEGKPAAEKAIAKPDPAEAPLPVFPIPSTEAPSPKVPQLPPAQP